MSSTKAHPASTVVAQLGGVRATARIVGCTPGAVSRWMMGKEKRGTEGRIPQKHWPLLLRHARAKRIKLTLKDLAGL